MRCLDDRGEPGGFDSIDAEAGDGLPPTDAVVLHAGEGERGESEHRTRWVKIGRDEIAMIELDIGPGFEGPGPHTHDDHVDSFYVLEGEVEFTLGDRAVRALPGTWVSVPPGVVHGFRNPGPGRARFLNVHTPDAGFADMIRGTGR